MGGPITAMLDDIASCSGEGPGVTRLPFTQEHHTAAAKIRKWMQDTGLAVHMDAAGTIIGRREGAEGGPTLLFGSHQDTVRHGGKYDGIMGVCCPFWHCGQLTICNFPFQFR